MVPIKGKKAKKKQGTSVLIALLTLLIIGSAVISYHNIPSQITKEASSSNVQTTGRLDASYKLHEPLAVRRLRSKNGTIFRVSLLLPNMCDDLSTGMRVEGTKPSSVHIAVTVGKTSTKCTATTTPTTPEQFEVSLSTTPDNVLYRGISINGASVASFLVGSI